jgi:hypothetical protein
MMRIPLMIVAALVLLLAAKIVASVVFLKVAEPRAMTVDDGRSREKGDTNSGYY